MLKRKEKLYSKILVLIIVILGFAAIPYILSRFYVYLTTEILIVSLFAVSTNLLLGYTGLLSFGQVAFFGTSAYCISLLLTKTEISFLNAFVISVILAAIAAMIIGYFCIRLRAFYFAILTLAFSQLFYAVAYKWIDLTGGDDGIVGVPKKAILFIDLSESYNYYYFVFIIVLLSLSALFLIVKSPFGEVLQAIRDNPQRAEFTGLNTRSYQIASFFIAGTFAGVAGALTAPFQGIVTPELLHWSHSAEPLMISLLGGMYNFFGPVAGSIIFVFIKEWITGFTEYWMFWYGLLLMFLIMYLPGGIVGYITDKIALVASAKK
jgi:branched-chain amino acid transport system permease protein